MSYKILYRIDPSKHVLESMLCLYFILWILCTRKRLYFHCIYSRLFWKDLKTFVINRKLNCMMEICFWCLFVLRMTIWKQHIIQLFVLLGKYHIHKNKWAQGKPIYLYKWLYIMYILCNKLKTKKQWKHVMLRKHWILCKTVFIWFFFYSWQLSLMWYCNTSCVLVALNKNNTNIQPVAYYFE